MANEQSRRLSEEEGFALVRQWRQSQEKKARFCRRTGVGVHVLRYWVAREAKRPGPAPRARGDFVVMSTPQPPRRSPERSRPTRSGKAVLVVMADVSSTVLAQTIRELLEEVER